MNFRFHTLFVVALAAMLFSALSPLSVQAQADDARVRVVHASPDAPAVDVYVNGDTVLTDVPFFTASDYLDLPAGEHRVQVAPAGTSADDAVIDANVTVNSGSAYTIAATGLLADIEATVLEDDLSPTDSGQARLSVYHFSPDAPPVDLKLADGTVLASGLTFPRGIDLGVTAGTYTVQVTPAGADDVVLELANTTLEEGTVYHVFAVDTLDNLTSELATTSVGTTDDGDAEEPTPTEEATEEPTPTPEPAPADTGTARVSVVHASPDAPAVDVYVDGDTVLTDVPFFTASDYLDLPAGEHRIQVAPAGTSADEAVIDTTADFEADTAYTVAATGLLDDIQPTVLVDDLNPTAAGEARVGVYHFSPDAPAVDVKLTDGTVLASNLPFPDGVEFTVPAGTYDIIVTPAGADDVVLDLANTTLEEGIVYDVYAVDVLENIAAEVTTTSVGTSGPAPQPEQDQPAQDQPAPAPTAAPTAMPDHDLPATLPETAEGDTAPVTGLLALAVLLLGLGGFTLALHRRLTS